jgi:outer membrane receptor protein involved in Fe transport
VLFPPYVNVNDAFGGFFIPSGINSSYYLGKNVSNAQRQYNIVDSLSFITGGHQFKFGIDWRRIGTYNGARSYDQFAYFTTPQAAAFGLASTVIVEAQDPGSILFRNFSVFAQDAWKIRPRLTLTYGARWEINPAPEGGPGHPLYTFTNCDDPRNLQLAPVGTKFYQTTWRNIAPRVGLAYELRRTPSWETTLRGGWGMFYDLGSGLLGQAAASFPYYRQESFYDVYYPLPPEAVMAPPFSITPPVASIYGAVSDLKLPVTYEWNVAVEQALRHNDVVSVSYVAAAGRNPAAPGLPDPQHGLLQFRFATSAVSASLVERLARNRRIHLGAFARQRLQ